MVNYQLTSSHFCLSGMIAADFNAGLFQELVERLSVGDAANMAINPPPNAWDNHRRHTLRNALHLGNTPREECILELVIAMANRVMEHDAAPQSTLEVAMALNWVYPASNIIDQVNQLSAEVQTLRHELDALRQGLSDLRQGLNVLLAAGGHPPIPH